MRVQLQAVMSSGRNHVLDGMGSRATRISPCEVPRDFPNCLMRPPRSVGPNDHSQMGIEPPEPGFGDFSCLEIRPRGTRQSNLGMDERAKLAKYQNVILDADLGSGRFA